ncbi:hypothetical protein BHE74_00018514 [Ensete ventricosum]|nr:hypothetical protein BHE74_00018514 [Ensete ventricosum]
MRPSLDPRPSPSSLAAEVQCNVTCGCYVASPVGCGGVTLPSSLGGFGWCGGRGQSAGWWRNQGLGGRRRPSGVGRSPYAPPSSVVALASRYSLAFVDHSHPLLVHLALIVRCVEPRGSVEFDNATPSSPEAPTLVSSR